MAEIDELIEQGLNLYGQGDLDGALLAWERALAVDPENAQANSYVDYVRVNYELLTGELENHEQQVPFGLEDEPYQIEILPAEAAHLNPAATEMQVRTRTADMDAGWFIDEEKSQPNRTLELQADEPPTETTPAISFEDQTREYAKANDFASHESTPGFETTTGFGTQPTNIKERDTGFVRATTRPDTSGGAGARAKRPSQVPPELEMTLRTPRETSDPYGNMDLPTDDAPPANASIALSYDDPSAEEAAGPHTKPLGSRSRKASLPPTADELINSLPSPTPSGLAASGARPADPVDDDDALQRADTRDLPPAIRPPAAAVAASNDMPEALQMPELPGTITRDFESQKTNTAQPKLDLNSQPTRDLPPGKLPFFGREMASAPTRDLGLRAMSDEETTTLRKPVSDRSDGTKADVILPFDPIDARSAQILDDIDEGAPDREAKEDRTRRRITLLFERAVGWAQAHELDKAVASIDLALSEDPNSALAQKLIHRHRDTIMQVFQQFLGDLDRQPVLARPLHELSNAPISPRAAFLLSRIDGALTLDELLDVSGMPRIEAYRYLCQLFLRGILR